MAKLEVKLDRAINGMEFYLESATAHIAAKDSQDGDLRVTYANGLKYASMVLGITELLLDALPDDDSESYVQIQSLNERAKVLIERFNGTFKLFVPTAPAMEAIQDVVRSKKPKITHVVAQKRKYTRRPMSYNEKGRIQARLATVAEEMGKRVDNDAVCRRVGKEVGRSKSTIWRIARGMPEANGKA